MKKYLINVLALVLSVLVCNSVFAQINSGHGAVPFGKNTQYKYGIMPTNLPAGGTYGQAQKAGDAYNTWKNLFVEKCGSNYRVKFDETQYTVSEGIAYGMLLSVYADDKNLFDGLWGYYKQWSNGNGVMHWKINGCNGVNQSNGATDAELDVAMALIIATEQWGNSYSADAKAMVKRIKQYEMGGDGQTLNGDAWGNTNSCRNPSYFAPAYYKEFAKVDADNASFWSGSAITASDKILKANRNATSGLVSNWCDNSGTENSCGNTGSGANGYGADACRNPWRMAVDYLWHGSDASSAAKDINALLVKFVNGNEAQLKGPFSNRNVSNPSSGSYINGSYSTFALPPMTSSSAQSSLNKCYTNVANLGDDGAYFNMTIRCVSLFVLTGNFWAPGASGFSFPPSVSLAEASDRDGGTYIDLTMNQSMTSGSGSASNFTVYFNGNAQSGIISSVSVSGSKVSLKLSAKPQPGQSIALSYDGNGSIKSAEGAEMTAFTKLDVLNMLAGNETIIDDVDDKNEFNNLGGIWFSFNDESNYNKNCTHNELKKNGGHGSSSSITPLSGNGIPFEISKTGYDGSGYCIYAKFQLGEGYVPYESGTKCASWHNPAFVGLGTYMHKDNESVVDWSKGTGVTFYYKGPACSFQVVTTDVTDGGFHFWSIDECKSWTKITKKFTELGQPTSWCKEVTFDPKHVQKLQWQWESSVLGAEASGEIYIDEVHVLGMPPVELTGLEISPVSNADLADDDCANNIDPLKIPIASGEVGDTCYLETNPTPSNATYPVVFWSSSDEDVVTIDYRGRVLGVGYGDATITARSKMHQNITTTYNVKVPAPSVCATAINFEESSYSVSVGGTATIIPTFTPANTNETGLTWKSSDATVATVSSSGVVTGIGAGTATITATTNSDNCSEVKKSVDVTVTGKSLESITASKTEVKIPVGGSETVSLTFNPEDADNTNVTWTSSDPTVATVVNGVISSVAAGECTITATAEADANIKAEIAVTVEDICVTSITLKDESMEIDVDSEDDIIVEVDSYETNYETTPKFTFTSSDKNVVRVDSDGYLTPRGEGTATITVTADDNCEKTATCEITVSKSTVAVTGVSLDKTTLTLTEGGSATLTATVSPSEATDKSVSWASDKESVATVDATGKVTAVSAGTATITVTTKDGSKTATCVVTVNAATVAVTGVSLDKETAAMTVGGADLTLVATVAPADATDKSVSWSSDKESVATVDATGKVIAVGAGEANITVKTKDGEFTATCKVTVTVPVASVTLDQNSATVTEGESIDLVATVSPDNASNTQVQWNSDKEDVAIVNGSGKVTAKAPGTATITVTTVDGAKTAQCVVTVEKKIILPTSISMAASLGFVDGGDAQTLTATILPADADNQKIIWSSSDETVATVADGVVTPVGVGSCVITAKCEAAETVSAECAVTVTASTVSVTGVSLDKETLTITAGDQASLVATVAPADATNQNLSWSSDKEAVATVANGVVTAVSAGTATITVKTDDGDFTASCTVTVEAAVVSVEGVSLDKQTLDLTVGGDATLTATIKPAEATNQKLSWKSDKESVATVADGKVTAVGAGDATITVKTEDGEFTATCKVTVTNAVVSVESVSLDKTSETIYEGASLQLTATVLPENASNKKVTWSSSNSNAVSVDQTGKVTALAEGDAIITVTTEDGSKTATCTIVVEEAPAQTVAVTGVTVAPTSLTLEIDEDAQLTATVSPANATNKEVVWSSNNSNAVSVDQTGKIVALAEGDATITVTTKDGDFTATCDVTVSEPGQGVYVKEILLTVKDVPVTELTMEPGGSKTIKATVVYSDGTEDTKADFEWASDNEDVAEIDEGWIDSYEEGVANITVSFGGKTAVCVVTVAEKITTIAVKSVALDKTTADVTMGGSLVLTAIVNPSNATNKKVSWTSSDESVATVAEDGTVTVLKSGSTTITVTTEDGGFEASCTVTVKDVVATGVYVDASLSLTVGGSETLKATVAPKGASDKVTWTSDNEKVATVDADGKVTAISAGTANITATTTDGSNLTSEPCVVTVSNVKVASVSLDATSLIVRVGATATLNATVAPAEATNKNINWSSSKDAATVSGGVVTGVSAGSGVLITAASEEDSYIQATCTVEVVDAAELASEISKATSAVSSAVEGTEIGTYKAGSKATLQSAISDAQSVYDNANATQSQIDMALATLQEAEKAFAKSINANETLLFDADMEQENMTYMATYWFSFNDATASSDPAKCGSSVVTPLSSEATPFEMTAPGYDGKGKAAMMEYVLSGKDALGYNPFVGMGLNFKEPAGKPFDMTGSTGISFWIKSDSWVYFEVEMVGINDACDYYTYLPDYKEWTLVELMWSDLEQYTWGVQVDWDLSLLTKCQWKVQEPDGEAGQVWIDDVKILGVSLDLPEILNRTPLYTAIAEAQAVLDEAVIGTADGNYPQSAATALENAIAEGQSVVDDKTLEHQTQIIAAVGALNEAVETFKNSVISSTPVDLSALEAKIATANNYYTTAQEGNEEGKYLVGSKATLKSAIDAATIVYNKASVTQTEVNSATTTLSNAIDAFLASKYVPGVVSKTILAATIADANTLYSTAVEGTAKGNYPAGSKATLYSAILSAQTVNSNTSATQDQVDAAVAALKSAIDSFKALAITTDKSSLVTTIALAKTALAKADGNTGEEPGQYPVESVAEFTTAISDAEVVNNNVAAKQLSIDAAVSLLQAAIDKFNASVIPGGVDIEALQALIDEADDLLNNTFNPMKYAIPYIELVNCKTSAKTEVAKTKHSVDDVTTISARLSDAIDAFKKAKAADPEEIDAVEDVADIVLTAYPNPCKNMIQISAGKEIAAITIVNLAGATQFFMEIGSTEATVNMSAVKAGVYFANVQYTDGTVETIRFVKK